MKRKSLIIAGVVVAVTLIVLIPLPLLIDADKYRGQVEEQASAALGRKVTIGKLKLSIFSGGVTASQLAVADDPVFSNQPFVTAKELNVGVELLPLIFSKAVRVTSLTLVEPEI